MAHSLQIEGPQPQISQAQIEPRETYEAAVKRMQMFATLTCIRVKMNCFFGLCTLTWTATVLLGGGVNNLTDKQFIGFAALLLAQAFQFGAIISWHGFLRPDSSLIHRRDCWTLSLNSISRSWLFGLIECVYLVVLAATLIFWGAHVPSIPDMSTFSTADRLTVHYIVIFFILAVSNAQITQIGLLFQVFVGSLRWPCLIKYYDSLVWVGLTQGLQGLRQLEVVDAVFEMMSQEFRIGGCKPEEVFIAYERMIEYVYGHDRGLEAALAAMESSDRYVQEAAVHMVGFWALHHERGAVQKKLRFENALLGRLVWMCTASAGPIGSKAARTIEILAKEDPEGLMKAGETTHILVQMLVMRVVELVDLLCLDPFPKGRAHDSIPHLYESLLHSCKALAWLLMCDKDCFCECITTEQQAHLAERLMCIFQTCHSSWKRMQVVVGHTLHLLDSTSLTEAFVVRHLKADTAAPTSSFVLFDEEQAWFDDLVGRDPSTPVAWDIGAFLKKLSTKDDIYVDARNASRLSSPMQSQINTFLCISQFLLFAYTGFQVYGTSLYFKAIQKNYFWKVYSNTNKVLLM